MSLRIALAQMNCAVGDFAGNVHCMLQMYTQAVRDNVDLLVFPELCLCGYPPEDLLLKKHFLEDNHTYLHEMAKDVTGMTVLVGFAEQESNLCYNSMAVIEEGKVSKVYRKCILPNYGVFDEKRYFSPGSLPLSVTLKNTTIVLSICEDIWSLKRFHELISTISEKDLIINISASPFNLGKLEQRISILSECAQQENVAIAYCNLVGGQDELVFDGRSLLMDNRGKVVCHSKAFEQDLLIADFKSAKKDKSDIIPVNAESQNKITPVNPVDEIYGALVTGTRDYVKKNGFKKVLIGLSGGIDSSLTAAIAVEALGKENVVGITMPSRFNTSETISDADLTATNLGIEFHTLAIADILDVFSKTLSGVHGWDEKGLAYENLQARIRGTILMSLSNQFAALVLTTGNKSETAVGYSTLYGDTAGGFAVIKDVPKTMVYQLSEYINKVHNREIIPQSVIDRPPSAELRPDQKDADSLPDYDVLDTILKLYVEDNFSSQAIVKKGMPADVVEKMIKLVDRNEYKRRQNPPGVKITPRAFGKDRRMPITNRYNET